MVFSADDRVLIKLLRQLRQAKEYGAKKNCPANREHCQD